MCIITFFVCLQMDPTSLPVFMPVALNSKSINKISESSYELCIMIVNEQWTLAKPRILFSRHFFWFFQWAIRFNQNFSHTKKLATDDGLYPTDHAFTEQFIRRHLVSQLLRTQIAFQPN